MLRLAHLVALLVLALAARAEAAVVGYELVSGESGVDRSNGLLDVSPRSACSFSFSAGNVVLEGCVDRAGDPCPAAGLCDLRRVPGGRCSYGGNLGCVWPNGAGFCNSDPNVGCLFDAHCPGGTCNLVTNDPACACQGTNPVAVDFEESVCGGVTGVCSDGDGAAVEFGLGAGVCSAVNLGTTAVVGCGAEAGQTASGPRFGLENPSHIPLLQRRPGLGFGIVPPSALVAPRTTFAYDVGPIEPARGGIRSLALLADSFFQDWSYLDADVTGQPFDLHAVAHLCRPPAGWNPSAPVAGGSYCHEVGLDSRGYVFTQNVDPMNPALLPPALDVDADGAPDCPPVCGTDYDLDSLEGLALEAVASLDANAGAQLAFEAAQGPAPVAGDRLELVRGALVVWAPAGGDLRCFVGGDPDAVCATCSGGLCGASGLGCATDRDCRLYVGRCSVSAQACDPAGAGTPCPIGQTCRACYGSFAVGVCTNSPAACRVDADCPGGACGDANGDPVHPRVGGPNPLALPVGYHTHGIGALELETKCAPARPGRIGGIAGTPIVTAAPFLALQTTGTAATQVRDPDSSAAPLDDDALGLASGGQVGIAEPAAPGTPLAGGSYATGRVLPVGGTCCASTGDVTTALDRTGFAPAPVVAANPTAITWPAGAAGAVVVPLVRAATFGAGANATPGCPGDSSPVAAAGALPDSGPCNDPGGAFTRPFCTGMDCEGNSGADDVGVTASIGGAPAVPAVPARRLTGFASGSAPILASVAALSGFDLDLGAAENVDFAAKLDFLACPLVGACSVGGAACLRDADCASGASCQNQAVTCPPSEPPDLDGDGISIGDNCPTVPNPSQANFDGDSAGDACDACETIVNAGVDTDGDGVDNACDTCTNVPNAALSGSPSANRTFVSHQRDDDADGRGNHCDFNYNQAGLSIDSTDFNNMKASFGKGVTLGTCGLAPINNQRCGEFDHNGAGLSIDATDFNLAKAAFGKAAAQPSCAACTVGTGWSNTLTLGPRLGRPVCQSAAVGACVYAP